MLDNYKAHKFIIDHDRSYHVQTIDKITKVSRHSPRELLISETKIESCNTFTLYGPDGITPSRVVTSSDYNEGINKLVDYIEFLEGKL